MYIIFSLILLGYGFYYIYKWLQDNSDVTEIKALFFLVLSMFIIVCSTAVDTFNHHNSKTYFVNASVYNYNTETTTFITNKNIFFNVDGIYDEDSEYVLLIDRNKTRKTSDDEVISIWECVSH